MATQPQTPPPIAEPVSELLLRWQELRQEGKDLTPEELCAEHPECIEDLRRQIQALQSMEAILGVGKKDTAAETPPVGEPHRTGPERAADGFPDVGGPVCLPGYEILRIVDPGGMGVVYQARQVNLNRPVAVKMILAGAQARPDQLTRFRIEAEAVAQLRHPHIVQIYEVGEYAGRPYFTMEFIEGGSLAQKLAKGLLPARQAAQLLQTLAEAIQFAHQHGIIH